MKKRSYRKTGSMSKRKIIDITSRKKRDTMLSVSSTSTVDGSQVAVGPGPAIARAGLPFFTLWHATARDLVTGGTAPNNSINEAQRTATKCYMRGLQETLRISTSDGTPWFHRRICFTTKAGFFPAVNPGATFPRPLFYESATTGMQRLFFNAANNNDTADLLGMYGVIFRGAYNIDWSDPITAPTDPTRITTKFDKTWVYKSGNTVGTVKETKLWHGMNKSLVYDDDEQGEGTQSSYFSTPAKPGMGNYLVVDILSAITGATGGLCRIDATSTLYWHEK